MEEHPQQVRRITALKETKRGRMAVFFDGEFDFSVDDETLLRHDLKVGKRLARRLWLCVGTSGPMSSCGSRPSTRRPRRRPSRCSPAAPTRARSCGRSWKGIFPPTASTG